MFAIYASLPETDSEIAWYVSTMTATQLVDGVDLVSPDIIIAIRGEGRVHSPSTVWFAWVMKVMQLQLSVRYFEKYPNNTSKYYILSESLDTVHVDSVICTGVPMEPKTKYNKTVWRLLIPVQYFLHSSEADHTIVPL